MKMECEDKKGGFALVTVLLLMGFLVTLVLGISVLLRLEFQLEDNVSDIKKAKANARIGLHMALGELQEKLGRDRRITVPSEFAVEVLDASDDSFIDVLGRSDKLKIKKKGGGTEGFYGYSIEDVGLSDNFKNALGVLSSTGVGGLKRDLSTYLSTGVGFDIRKEGNSIFEDPVVEENDDYIPKWELVRSFYELAKFYNNQGGGVGKTVKPRGFPYVGGMHDEEKIFYPDFDRTENGSTTPLVHGVGPVIIACSFGFAHEFNKDENGNFKNEAEIKYFVTVVLWNPYDFGLGQEEYVFEIKPKGRGADIALGRMPQKEFEFKGSIRHGFLPGEVSLFSLFSEGGQSESGYYNLLTNHDSALGKVLQVQNIRPSNQREERGNFGGFGSQSSGVKNNGSYSVSWGEGSPMFSLLLLSKGEDCLYQEVDRLGVGEEQVFFKDIEVSEVRRRVPFFAMIFKNSMGTMGGLKEYLKNYNPRAPVACPTKNLKLKSNPYQVNAFVEGAAKNDVSWKFDGKDFTNPPFGSIFSIKTCFASLSFMRHVNFGALERHAAFAFGNSFRHSEIPRSEIRCDDVGMDRSYFYDYSYKLNESLWDQYFLSGKRDYPREIFEKNFVKLRNVSEEGLLDMKKCAGCVLLGGAFNVNSISVAAWMELLGGLQGLSRAQLEHLAMEVVRGVKERGPFYSLGSFVNRRLENSDFGECGVLQAALKKAQIEKTQAEVLEVIGHRLAVRSDSFIVRAYGEASTGFSGKIRARACCEAFLQRVPEYLEASENLPEDELGRLSKINQQFGRRFKVVSFRWANF